MSSPARTQKEKTSAVGTKKGRGGVIPLMNIHQSNGIFGQIKIKAFQAGTEWE